ncbi:hypothetical protein N7530_005184 [Penicillium desertorum]|uniref:Uncharacterized protein n=1 Tax=Penicillium desertorum TaxID=1303715 RepID=A0A9X0BR43_9EURO|nr:hypothetical protein N7530_005184 [Penicillium desertorum]
MSVKDSAKTRSLDLVTQEIDDEAVGEAAEQIMNIPSEHSDEIDEIPGLDDPLWNSLNEDKNEDDDLAQRAFEEAFDEAKDPVKHAQNIQEILSFMGEEAKDPNLPWETAFFDLHELDDWAKAELHKFSQNCKIEGDAYPQCEDYDKPMCWTRNTWPREDIEIDEKWQLLVNDLCELPNGMIIPKSLTKPSGRWDAPVAILWNYPTWTTTNICWSQALDSCNPCVRTQYAKLGPNPYIRTQNRIPIREKWSNLGVDWTRYPNWEEIEAKCLQFCRWLNTRSKIIIILGKENALMPRDCLIEVGDSLESIPVKICCNKRFKLYGETPQFEIIRDRQTKAIQHLVYVGLHTQTFFHDIPLEFRAYQDISWNSACGMVGIPVPRPIYFLRHAYWFKKRPDLRLKWSQLCRARILRNAEIKQDMAFPEHAVRAAFSATLALNPTFKLAPDKNGSYVGAIIRMFIAKAWAKQSTEKWRTTPQAAKMFGTSISNLLDPVAISKRQATVRTEEWKLSDAAKRQKDGRLKAARGPKKFGAWDARLDAFFKTKQARDRVAADPQTLTTIGVHSQQRLRSLHSEPKARIVSYFKAHVIFYSKAYPKGLRFKGDGGIPRDTFPYGTVDHPAVILHGSWSKEKRKDFEG